MCCLEEKQKEKDGMTLFNTRVFCGACLVLAAVAYAAEVDFVCSVANSSSIVCPDCNNFCNGCGITCNDDGHITAMFVFSSFLLPCPSIHFDPFTTPCLTLTASGPMPRSRLFRRQLLI